MANIKDVAKAAGVSPTTVSLIINGKGRDGRISKETEKRVYEVMRELDYHPNMSARRLRTYDPPRSTIAFYWPSDYRSHVLSSFIRDFTQIRDELGFDVDMVVLSYKNGALDKFAEPIKKNSYNGIVIGGPSAEDMQFLENVKTRTPIVLLNRDSEKYSTVSSDNMEMGFLAARLIKQKGYDRAAVFSSDKRFEAASKRVESFMYACSQIDINIDPSWIFTSETSMKGGAASAAAYCRLENPPKVIFCDADFLALGALHEFYRQHKRIPEDVEILAVQFLANDYAEYSIPSLTTLVMPNSALLKASLEIISKQIKTNSPEAVHVTIPASIHARETF